MNNSPSPERRGWSYSTRLCVSPWGYSLWVWGPVPPDWARSSETAVSSQPTPAPSSWLPLPPSAEKINQHPYRVQQPLHLFCVCVCVCVSVCVSRPQPKLTGFQAAEEWKRAVVITFLQAVCPGFIYSCLPVSFITVKAGKSGKTAQAPLALCLSFTSSSSSLGQKKKVTRCSVSSLMTTHTSGSSAARCAAAVVHAPAERTCRSAVVRSC